MASRWDFSHEIVMPGSKRKEGPKKIKIALVDDDIR